MRHRKARQKLGMRTSHREAVLRNMVTSLLEHETIVTTDARAKALRSLADKMITLGKRGDLHARRQVLEVIRSKDVAKRLFDEIAPRFAGREGGYVRVIKKGIRTGDSAAMSLVELVEKQPQKAAAGKPGKKKLTDRIRESLRSGK
ncbi:MAG: 50S ribosomal protein L17 [Desulfomonile sp.]|nr:50S ribosomal protein L17 [Desulfomonile sp.]